MKSRAKKLLGKVKGTVGDLRDQVAEQASDAKDLLDPEVLKGGIEVVKDKIEEGLRSTPLEKYLPSKSEMPTPSANQLEARRQAEGGDRRAEGHVSPKFGEPAGDHNSLGAVAADAMAERKDSATDAATKPAAKKVVAKKKAATKKTATKKAAAKKPAAKKVAAKKAAVKKAPVRKTAAKKAAVKKSAAKKTTAKKKAAVKKAAVKKVVAKKSTAKKASAKKTAAKKT